MTLARLAPGLAVSALLVACDPGDGSVSGTATTGTEDSGSGDTGATSTGADGPDPASTGTPGDDGGSGDCVFESTPIGLEDDVPAGVTPQALLDSAIGVYSGGIRWLDDASIPYVGGDLGPTALEVEVVYEGGEARSIVEASVVPCVEGEPCTCSTAVEVDVTLRIETADGVLDESFGAALRFGSDGTNTFVGASFIRILFAPDDATGSLSAASFAVEDGFDLESLEFNVIPDRRSLSGSLLASAVALGAQSTSEVAVLGAVQDAQACHRFLRGGPASPCMLAGCGENVGYPLSDEPECSCGELESFCFPGVTGGVVQPTLYTRRIDNGFSSYDEVVEFDTEGVLGGDWMQCSEAPDVALCQCDVVCE